MGDAGGSQARAKMRDETICDAAEEDAMQPRRRRRRPKMNPGKHPCPGGMPSRENTKNNERTYRGTYSREEVRIATKDNGFL